MYNKDVQTTYLQLLVGIDPESAKNGSLRDGRMKQTPLTAAAGNLPPDGISLGFGWYVAFAEILLVGKRDHLRWTRVPLATNASTDFASPQAEVYDTSGIEQKG